MICVRLVGKNRLAACLKIIYTILLHVMLL
jgi:hypothetical protein